MNDNSVKKILVLAANPLDTVRLKLEREVEEIRTTLKLSTNRDRFTSEQRGAVRRSDLQQYLFDVKPWIVHFAGHGLGEKSTDDGLGSTRKVTVIDEREGLVFEDDNGNSQLVSGVALANLFALFSKDIKCVVLNACYSAAQAREIIKHIPYVVGMKREIGDIAARKFSEGFYRAIWDDRSIAEAFASGKNAIELDGIPEELTPILLTRLSGSSDAIAPEDSQPKETNSTRSSGAMSEGKRRRLEQDKEGLENQANLIGEKLNCLRTANAIETNPAIRFQLEKQIDQAESEIEELEIKLAEIENTLNSKSQNDSFTIPTPSPDPTNETKTIPPNLDNPEGAVSLDSPFYIERQPIENKCYAEIVKPGALLRIKAPRQMGKSSLMLRIIQQAQAQNYATVNISLQSAGAENLVTLDRFWYWFCGSVAQELNLPNWLDECWSNPLGSNNKCTKFFESYLLPEIQSPLVLGLDEVDELFKHREIASDVFGLLRSWHEKSRMKAIWKNFRLIVTHSKEVYIPLNINQSPFNVGLPIDLPPFNRTQVSTLLDRHGLRWSDADLDEFLALVGGHPFLVRVALYHIARQEIALTDLVKIAPTEGWVYGEHLRRHLLNLEEDPDLVAAFTTVVAATKPVSIKSTEAFRLASMGLIRYQNENNHVLPFCDLYRRYFRDRLGVK